MTGVLVPVSGSVGSAGCRFFVGMERGTPEEGGIDPGGDGVVDAVEVLEYEDAGLFFVCMDVVEGRQRKVASLGGCSRGCF